MEQSKSSLDTLMQVTKDKKQEVNVTKDKKQDVTVTKDQKQGVTEKRHTQIN